MALRCLVGVKRLKVLLQKRFWIMEIKSKWKANKKPELVGRPVVRNKAYFKIEFNKTSIKFKST